jgi:hypothetical protein
MNGVATDLHWSSDWNGDEVGFPEIDVVGLYSSEKLGCHFYMDMSTNEILEVMIDVDEDEEDCGMWFGK